MSKVTAKNSNTFTEGEKGKLKLFDLDPFCTAIEIWNIQCAGNKFCVPLTSIYMSV